MTATERIDQLRKTLASEAAALNAARVSFGGASGDRLSNSVLDAELAAINALLEILKARMLAQSSATAKPRVVNDRREIVGMDVVSGITIRFQSIGEAARLTNEGVSPELVAGRAHRISEVAQKMTPEVWRKGAQAISRMKNQGLMYKGWAFIFANTLGGEKNV